MARLPRLTLAHQPHHVIQRGNQMLNEITANGTDPAVVANAFVDTL